ncbi:MAG TPA: hypothetical protein VK819_04815 [Acidobacteriaceae bacterium]|jgi:hypothetical protein|nr:hypothetical protein [Acidobacteriaceae bacterium]
MVAIVGIVLAVGLAICFLVLRLTGRLGQAPSPKERAKHSAGNPRPENPRASGLN